MKKLFSMLMGLCLVLVCLTLLGIDAQAAMVIDSGECGKFPDEITWTLTTDRVLTLSGYGPTEHWWVSSQVPWDEYRSSINSVVIGNGIAKIGAFAFMGCSNLTSVTIPNSVTIIESYAFRFCDSLNSITIPNSVTIIENDAFSYCGNLTSITIPNSVTDIEDHVFMDCRNLTSVIIPNSVTSIGAGAFSGCDSLISITIPDSVTNMKGGMFSGCNSLTAVSIPDSVVLINDGCFSGCDNLQHIAYSGTKAQWDDVWKANNSFDGVKICYNAKLSRTENCKNSGVTCSGCKTFIATGPGVASKHSYTSAVTYPTATAHGYTTFTCSFCGDEYVKNYTFPDVQSRAWYYKAVEFNVAKGYFSGYKSGDFGPGDEITREDFVVVLARIEGVNLSKYSGRTNFKDVKAGSYYEAAINWASKSGIVAGYNATKFGVGDKLTREQLVTILYRYAQRKGGKLTANATGTSKLNAFGDSKQVSDFAKNSCAWALQNNVLGGLNATTFGPQRKANRAQVAQILMNICNNKIINF